MELVSDPVTDYPVPAALIFIICLLYHSFSIFLTFSHPFLVFVACLHFWGASDTHPSLRLLRLHLTTKFSNLVVPPTESPVDLSCLVSLSTQSSWKIWIFPFSHCSVIVVSGRKSFCGSSKGVTHVYTCCSILGFFLRGLNITSLLIDGL